MGISPPTSGPASTDEKNANPYPRAPEAGSMVLAAAGSSVGLPSASRAQSFGRGCPYNLRLSTFHQDEMAHAISSTKGAPVRVGTPQLNALLAVAGCRPPNGATVAGPVLVVLKLIIPASTAI